MKLQAIEFGMSESVTCEQLYVNETNAVGSIPVLAFIPNPMRMAQQINEEVERLLDREFRGVIQMDFPERTESGELIEKIIAANFRRE